MNSKLGLLNTKLQIELIHVYQTGNTEKIMLKNQEAIAHNDESLAASIMEFSIKYNITNFSPYYDETTKHLLSAATEFYDSNIKGIIELSQMKLGRIYWLLAPSILKFIQNKNCSITELNSLSDPDFSVVIANYDKLITHSPQEIALQ